jgi:hypothetical protein
MGLKLRGVIRCGRCGKSRGITHTCVSTRRKTRRHRMQALVEWTCSRCGKRRGVAHTCVIRTDFKARRRKQAAAERRRKRQVAAAKRKLRRQLTAADRKARDRARKHSAKRRTSAPPRPRGGTHEPGTCGDQDCPKYGCQAYFEGMTDCPREHVA